jgi:hypothetical protein
MCLLALVVASIPRLLTAAEDAPLRLEEGFVRLDNGKDLTGWYGSKWSGEPTGDARGWSVVDGAIQLDATVATSHLFCETHHSRNCVVRLQYCAAKGADSGLSVHGQQFQVRDYPNSLPDTQPYARHAKPPGSWNDLELDITDGVAVIRLNGHVIEKAWKIGGNPERGPGLQKEVGDFKFRFLRVKEKT